MTAHRAGLSTLPTTEPKTLFSQAIIRERRRQAARAFDAVLGVDEGVLVFSGTPIHKPGGLDQQYRFLAHPDYYWLTGSRNPYEVVLYSKTSGWVSFVKQFSVAESVWDTAPEYIEPDGVGEKRSLGELVGFIQKLSLKNIWVMGQGYEIEGLQFVNRTQAPSGPVAEKEFQLSSQFVRVRRRKDASEVALIKQAAAIARVGYEHVRSILQPGVTERAVAVEYEYAIKRAGAQTVPYGTIVGSAQNGGVLHATPGARVLQAGDLVLIDAGVDLFDYCVDITRMFAVGGAFSSQQKEIIDLVGSAQNAAIELCTMGRSWLDVHKKSAEVIADGLRHLGILKGSREACLETGALALFYPHGVGHLVGLRVRDTGVVRQGPPPTVYGAYLRVDIDLDENNLVTVEPGCYFHPTRLAEAYKSGAFNNHVDWTIVEERWLDFGGVRIEDDILVTPTGPQNLTAVVSK
jgi:Xaa-Pro dipeptidase